MVFAATDNPNNVAGQTVANLAFYMEIAVDDFTKATRTTDSIDDQRTIHALRGAMFETNVALSEWAAAQKLLGHTNIADVESEYYGDAKEVVHLYKKAIYAMAKAILIEKYRDVDTTTDGGNQRVDEFNNTKDDYLAEYHHALAAIQGKSGNINVLI